MLTKETLEDVATRTINALFGANNSSYLNSFSIQIDERQEEILLVPIIPSTLIFSDNLVQQIYQALSFALYPEITTLAPEGVQVVATNTKSFSNARAIKFRYIKGIPERLIFSEYPNFNSFKIPIMKNYIIDFEKETSVGISGYSGSGKSYLTSYLLTQLNNSGAKIVAIDPKSDDLSLLAKKLNIECLNTSQYETTTDFVENVNKLLARFISEINARQKKYLETGMRVGKKTYIVVDELIVLLSSANKIQSDLLKKFLEQIGVIGRSSGIHLILVAQDFNISSSGISSTLRNQLSVKIAMGNATSTNLQYLFPDVEGIIIPKEVGTGVISSNSILNNQPYPFLAPTIRRKEVK